MVQIKSPRSIFLPSGPNAVLLLHAYSGSPNDVRMLARALEKKTYTVYAPMFNGHGTANPADILEKSPADWWKESQEAISFLKSKGYEQIAVFGLSMGGIFATRLLATDASLLGGGFFCSPIAPVETQVEENFLEYAKQLLTQAQEKEVSEQVEALRPQVKSQLEAIQVQAAESFERLEQIKTAFFMAQAGKDKMIDASGVFQTARALENTHFTLKWYPESGHVITVGPERREFERDVADFLATLEWRE
ncbi:carboxylesterase [Enterococcus florum]|uniref:Carboxylesterase n=1 Tax=Enterococcus florum TaxID=2480627 RepID=A0A4P5P666_9ENTE|nr:carboxylesterase [Enterococcus florum]